VFINVLNNLINYMNKSLIEINKLIIFFAFSFLLFFISIYQTQYFHWSSILDQDITIIYNSLLISSGIEQEYRDHPGYSTFLIYGVILKFFSLFNLSPIGHIDELINSINPDKDLQNLFLFCRNVNVAINIFLILILYKLLIKLRFDEISSILGCCILAVSGWYTESLFVLRNENLSLVFFIVSIMSLIHYNDNNKPLFIVLSGFFFGFAMLTKIQIIFLFIFFLIIYLITINEKIFNKNIIKFTKKYDLFFFLFYILFFLSFVILQLKLQTFERFEKIKNLDLILFLGFNFFIFSIFIIRNKFEITKLKLFTVFLGLYFIGFTISIFFTIFLDLIGFIKLNYFILLRITNPFHYMIEFHVGDHLEMYNDVKVGFDYFKNLLFIALSKFDYNILKIAILIMILFFSLRIDWKKKNKTFRYKFIIKLLVFFGLISIIFIMNLRGFLYYYETLVVVPYILVMFYFLKKFSKKYIYIINFLVIIYFAYCNFFLQEKRKYSFDYYFTNQTSMNLLCKNDQIFYQDYSYVYFLQYYQNRFSDDFIERLCVNFPK